jgi:hypothetical protein
MASSVRRERDKVPAGALPNRRPDRMWGGPSDGAFCAICRTDVERGEPEFEIEFVGHGDDSGTATYHVHIRCFAAWVPERQR